MTLVRVQLRHDTYQNWYDNNPLLLSGEVAVVTDLGKIKVGDGNRNFRSLPYVSAEFHPSQVPPAVGTGSAGTSSFASRADHTHDLPSKISTDSISVTSASVSGDLTVGGNLVGGSHVHSVSEVEGLPSILLGTASLEHKHNTADITNFPATSTGTAGSVLTWDGFNIVWGDPVDAVTGNVTGLTAEQVDDRVSALIQPGSNINVVYDDAADSLTISLADQGEWEPSPIQSPPSGQSDPSAPSQETPVIDSQPPSSVEVSGEAVTLSVVVSGISSESYQWQVWGGSSWQDLSEATPYSGTTTSSLTISTTDEDDADTYYRCKVSDSSGNTVLISSSTTLIWIDPNAPVPPLALTQDIPSEISVQFDSSGNYDISGQAAVVATGGTGSYQYQWQASDVSGSSQNGFGRGSLWVNLPGETASTLSSVSESSVIWLQTSADNPSYEEQIIFLRCQVTSITDVANLTGPVIYSTECRLVVSPPPATVLTNPADSVLLSNGTASFSATFGGRSLVSWERRANDGSISTVPASLGTHTVVAISAGASYETVLSLTGLELQDVGTQFRVRLESIDGSSSTVSAWASLTGNPVRITQQPPASTSAIYGASVNISFDYSPTAGTTVSWESRTDYSGTPTTIAGATSTTLSISSATQNAEYRGVVTSSSGVTRTAWALVGIVTPSADSGDPEFTQQLSGAALYENQYYTDQATSSLLAGSEAVDHYAVLAVEFADGRKELRPLATGLADPDLGPLRFFPANQGFNSYRVNTQIDGDCTVSILAAINPHAVSGTTGTISGSPWAKVAGNKFFVPDARSSKISFPQADGQYRVTSGLVQQTGVIQYPFPAYGFVRSQEVDLTVQSQEPFYGPVGTGPWAPPQSNSLRGACNEDGVVVAAPHSHPDVTILLSEDEGRTWGTKFAPFPIQAFDTVVYNGFFYVFTLAPGNRLTAIRSEDGKAWTDTGWNFGALVKGPYSIPPGYDPSLAHDRPNQIRASVANGVLYLSMYERNSRGRWDAYLWRLASGGSWLKIAMPGMSGVVSGAPNYLVSGQCYSTNGGTAWNLAPGAIDLDDALQLDFIEGMWEMRGVTYGGSTYYISHNRPDDKYHYHYTPSPQFGGTRMSYLDQFANLLLPTTTVDRTGASFYENRARYYSQWVPFIGPPVGQYLYALAVSSESNVESKRPILFRVNAATPNVPGGPEVLVKFEHAQAEKYGGFFDATSSSPSLYRGGYNYGPLDQLDTKYLDGTWSPNAGPLIFCRNRVLAAFRTGRNIPSQSGSPWVGPPPPSTGNI